MAYIPSLSPPCLRTSLGLIRPFSSALSSAPPPPPSPSPSPSPPWSHRTPRIRRTGATLAVGGGMESSSTVFRGGRTPTLLHLDHNLKTQAYSSRTWHHRTLGKYTLLSYSPPQPLLRIRAYPQWCAYPTNGLIRAYSLNSDPGYGESKSKHWQAANRRTLTYMVAMAIAVVGLSYAAVPLYRLFCQASGYGGTVGIAGASDKVESMRPVKEREITIRFDSGTSAAMQWQFKPQQREIKLVPGETALAFYTATNPTDKPVTGIATYNVIPFAAGLYFNKIQCFCFEEQRLNPNEQVDMPVFFYIDPEFNEDPAMAKVDTITLSYMFFEAKEGDAIYLPLQATHTN